MLEQTSLNRKNLIAGLSGAAGGFIMGILGNLVAAWIQQDWLNNQFKSLGVILIVGLTLVGLVLSVWWSHHHPPATEQPAKNKLIDVDVTNNSELTVKGEGSYLERVKSDDHSTIHIES